MYVNVVFVIRCLHSAVSLTLVKEEHFIRIITCENVIFFYLFFYRCLTWKSF